MASLPQDVTRFDRSMMTIVGANGRKYPLNSISGTTSSAQTTLATTDAIGTVQPGQLDLHPARGGHRWLLVRAAARTPRRTLPRCSCLRAIRSSCT